MASFTGSAWHFFNSFRLWESDGTFDMDLDASTPSLWVSLHTSVWTPDVTKTVKADLTNEVANGAGGIYVTGGKVLTGATFTQQSPTNPEQVKLTAPSLSWIVASGSLAAMYAVIRLEGTRNSHVNPLVAYCALDNTTVPGTPSTVTTASGSTLTLAFPSGIYVKLGGN